MNNKPTEDQLFRALSAFWIMKIIGADSSPFDEIASADNQYNKEMGSLKEHMETEHKIKEEDLISIWKIFENNEFIEDEIFRIGSGIAKLARMLECEDEIYKFMENNL